MSNRRLLIILKIIFITAILVAVPLTIMFPEKDLTFLIKIFEKINTF